MLASELIKIVNAEKLLDATLALDEFKPKCNIKEWRKAKLILQQIADKEYCEIFSSLNIEDDT